MDEQALIEQLVKELSISEDDAFIYLAADGWNIHAARESYQLDRANDAIVTIG